MVQRCMAPGCFPGCFLQDVFPWLRDESHLPKAADTLVPIFGHEAPAGVSSRITAGRMSRPMVPTRPKVPAAQCANAAQGADTSEISSTTRFMTEPCSSVKVDPFDCHRLWIVFQQSFGQLDLEVAVHQRNSGCLLSIITEHANRRPAWALGSQW